MSKYTAYARKKISHTILIFTNAKKTHPTYFQIITIEKSKEKNPKHKSFPL